MQSTSITNPDRNPNGYSAAEILRALQGVDGTRELSFRYELLDSTNRKKSDLTNVLGGKIEQNWLADIKRKASFEIQDQDQIDFLQDRIKPFARIRMPPKEIPAQSAPPLPPAPEFPLLGSFTDNFATESRKGEWEFYSNGTVNASGFLETPAASGTFAGARTFDSWSFLGTEVVIELLQVVQSSGPSDNARNYIEVGPPDSASVGDYIEIRYEADDDQIVFRNNTGFSDAQAVALTYDPVEHRWLKMREYQGTIFWETSPDSLEWTVHKTVSTPAWVTTDDLALHLLIESFRDLGPTSSALWDNLNLGQSQPRIPAPPDVVWRNTFNGTPGISGEAVTVANSGNNGDFLDGVSGTLTYDETWSVDSRKSIKMGSDDGSDSGSFFFNIDPRSDWSLRVWMNIPTGSYVNFFPDGIEADPVNYFVFDDTFLNYRLGDIDISALRPHLFGQPFRFEVVANSQTATYRLYWTDPFGTTPDYTATQSTADWMDTEIFQVSGGGFTRNPSNVDNILIGEPAAPQFTDSSVNFVEWPQGVFLLSSPTRVINAEDVITRSVDAYDQLQVYQDDMIPDRFSSDDQLDEDDTFLRNETGTWGQGDSGFNWEAVGAHANTTTGVTTSSGGYGFMELNADPNIVRPQSVNSQPYRDGEIFGTLGVDQTATGASMLPSMLFRLTDLFNYYRIRFHFNTDGSISISVARTVTQVGDTINTSLTYSPGELFNVRGRLIGHRLTAKIWAIGTDEPAAWMIDETIPEADEIQIGLTGYSASTFVGNSNTDPEMRFGSFEFNANPRKTYTGLVSFLLGKMVERVITPSETTIPTVREWDPGTSKLQIINELLQAINYETLHFDEDGRAIVKPYVSPQFRTAEYDYFDDELSVIYPEVTQELDLFDIPNRWILSVSDPDREAVTASFTNDDPASPTSTLRRGRTITDFRNEEDAADKSSLLEKASRLAFEATQVYESIEFSTAIMPIHSGNDVYNIRREAMAVDAKYSEHTWEMPLEAGAAMTHRARRVVTLGPASDSSVKPANFHVTGNLTAGNMAYGRMLINPIANTPTNVSVVGLDLQGTGPVRAQANARSAVPGTTVWEVGVSGMSPTGFLLWLYRTNTTGTNVNWFVMRDQ